MVTYDEIKQKIIEALNLEDITADEIEDDAPLFNEGLGLDSVDAIELIIFLDNQYIKTLFYQQISIICKT